MDSTVPITLSSILLVTLLSLCIHRYGRSPLLQAVLRSLRPVVCAMVTYAAISMLL